MPGMRAVGDDRTTPGDGLETRHAAGRMHERVRGCEQIAHSAGETQDAHMRVVTEFGSKVTLERFVAARNRDHVCIRNRDGRARRAGEVTNPPTASRDHNEASSLRNPELAPYRSAVGRREELTRDERPCHPSAPGSGLALDLGDEALVHDEVQVDARVSPEADAAEVGDRRARDSGDASSTPEMPEHARRSREGRDHEIGVVLANEPLEPAPTEGRPQRRDA